MSADAYTTWSEHSLDTVPDITVMLALRSGDEIGFPLEAIAVHLAIRDLTWELILVGLDVDVVSPFGDDLANAFFVERSALDDRLGSLRRASVHASGNHVLLAAADLGVGIVHLDDIVSRLDAGADIVVGWPYPDAVTPDGVDLPIFVGCTSGVMRALGDARSVYGGSTFTDAVQIAHFWGLEVDEVQVDVAIADTVRPRTSIRPVGRVIVGPIGLRPS